jgi:alpha-1,3-rhamnosyl/mannosyltransferase
MACGVPVVTSHVGSLPEVCGEAAAWIDPFDEASIEHAMLEVLTDPARQASLRAAGLEQARRFDWQETARQTLALYREAYQSTTR